MTSVLNVDTIADKAGTGPVALTKQQAAKAWWNYDLRSDPSAVRDSFNISTFTDNGTGDLTESYTNNMANAGYNISSGLNTYHDASDYRWLTFIRGSQSDGNVWQFTTSEMRTQTNQVQNGAGATDSFLNTASVTGDLA
jgi:hypothetical protein